MSNVQDFAGFPADLFGFLEDLARNNNRDWFNENRERYRSSVVEPVSAFITALAPGLQSVSTHFIANPKPHGGSMFRIYRDARFSRDKRPYKTHVACQFRHEAGRDAHAPGFYLHLEPGGVFVGGGVWHPSRTALEQIRAAIAENPNHWRKATRSSRFIACFGGLEGESLQRAPRGYSPDHPDIADLKRKDFFASRDIDPALAMSTAFMDETLATFDALGPLMDFLTYALDLPY